MYIRYPLQWRKVMSLADLQEHIICFEMFMIDKKELEAWLELAVLTSLDSSPILTHFQPNLSLEVKFEL